MTKKKFPKLIYALSSAIVPTSEYHFLCFFFCDFDFSFNTKKTKTNKTKSSLS